MTNVQIAVIRYIPGKTKTSRRRQEIELSAVRAHAARVTYQRRHQCQVKSQGHCTHSLHNDHLLCQDSKENGHVYDVESKPEVERKYAATARPRVGIMMDFDEVALNFTLVQLIDGSYFEYLPSIYSQASPDHVLVAATKCVALACFARWTGREALLHRANLTYQRTLRQLQDAMNTTASACSDGTLGSVLLIMFFELLAGGDSDQISRSLTSHLQGAIAIMETRIKFGMKSKIGDEMLLQIWDILVTQRQAQKQIFPGNMDHLLEASTNRRTFAGLASQPHTRELPQRINDLRANVARGIWTDCVFIVDEAMSIVDSLNAMRGQFLAMWPSSTVESDLPIARSFRGSYHVYPNGRNPWRMVSFYCMSLIYMHTIIIAHVTKAQDKGKSSVGQDAYRLLELSKNEVEKAAALICTLIPQHLQPSFRRNHYEQIYLRKTVDGLRAHNRQEAFAEQPEVNLHAYQRSSDLVAPRYRLSSASSLLWPLYVAGSATQSDELRAYIVDRLRYIAETCRIQLANDAAESVESRVEMNEHGLESLYMF